MRVAVIGNILDRCIDTATVALLAIEVGVVFAGVVTRYVGLAIYGIDELAGLILLWLTFFGGAVALREGQHVGVAIFVNRLPPRAKGLLQAAVLEASLALLAALGWQSWQLFRFRAHTASAALELPYGLFVAPMVIGILIMMAYGLAQLFSAPLRQVLLAAACLALVGVLVAGLTMLAGWDLQTTHGLFPMVAGFLLLLILGTPIAFSLVGVSLAFLVLMQGQLIVMPQRMLAGVNSFVLLAIPLFILAGALMETGGISRRLIDLALALVGHIKGGLAYVVVLGEILFSGISGSTMADVAAIGSLLIPAMVKAGYSREEAVSIVSAASAMGILVPPCLLMIIIGALANISVTSLFLAGFLPALFVAVGLLGLISFKARRCNWSTTERVSRPQLKKAIRGSILPLLMPVIIFGSIFTGITTITEAAVVAVVYALWVSVFVYREIRIAELPRIFLESGTMTGMVFWLVGGSTLFTWLLAAQQAPQQVAGWITRVSGDPSFFVIASVGIFSVLSGLLEGFPAVIILGPIFFPIASQMGIDPVHYAILITACVGIGLFLPPVGMGLFIGCSIGRTSVTRVLKPFAPYLLVLLLMTVLVGLLPQITLLVPKLVEGK